jgi:hypothetical protein
MTELSSHDIDQLHSANFRHHLAYIFHFIKLYLQPPTFHLHESLREYAHLLIKGHDEIDVAQQGNLDRCIYLIV